MNRIQNSLSSPLQLATSIKATKFHSIRPDLWKCVRHFSTETEPLSDQVRSAMRHFAQSVSVITVPLGPHHYHGATVSSLSCVSLAPPIFTFNLRWPSRMASFLTDRSEPSYEPTLKNVSGSSDNRKRLFIHLLADDQQHIAAQFARSTPHPDDDLPLQLKHNLFEGQLALFECVLVAHLPLSRLDPHTPPSHDIGVPSELFLARIEHVHSTPRGQSTTRSNLMYWNRRYGSMNADSCNAEMSSSKWSDSNSEECNSKQS